MTNILWNSSLPGFFYSLKAANMAGSRLWHFPRYLSGFRHGYLIERLRLDGGDTFLRYEAKAMHGDALCGSRRDPAFVPRFDAMVEECVAPCAISENAS